MRTFHDFLHSTQYLSHISRANGPCVLPEVRCFNASMRQRPELDPNLHPLTPSAVLVSCSQVVDRFRRADLVSTLEEHREDMPRPIATDLGSRGALRVSRGVSST